MGLSFRHCNTDSVTGGLFKTFALGARSGIIGSVSRAVGVGHLSVSAAALHAVVMGLFASTIAPFGGFLASGFKRAFKIKDFSSILPGHGARFCLTRARHPLAYFLTISPRRTAPWSLLISLQAASQTG
jgi:hypothetical protein